MTEVIAGLFFPILVMLVVIMVSERMVAGVLMVISFVQEAALR